MQTPAEDTVTRLAAALDAAGFRYDAVAAVLGPQAHAALGRNETTPGLRATTGGSPLETLVRLWLLQAEVGEGEAARALPGLVPGLCAAGVLDRSGSEVRALVDVRPYADEGRDWWVVSDLTPGLDGRPNGVPADHVLGISGASTALTQLTVREPVNRALDLGCGCGVQSLHLAGHAGQVVATDVNRRALEMTRFNALLNGLAIDVREGSLFEPVEGETFDLVVSNPPFVISPATEDRLVYRDSGLPGDELVRRVVAGAGAHLSPGGWAQVLVNWLEVEGTAWDERVAGWLDGGVSCDAWVVQREVADPAQYVELWLRDAGQERSPVYTQRYDAWMGWFDAQSATGVGMGWVNLRRTDSARGVRPVVRMEQWPYEVEQPLGPEVAEWGRRVDLLRGLSDDEVLATRWRVRDDVRQEAVGAPGATDPEVIVLRQQRGMRRARQVDTVEAALVGASDGDLTARRILDAVATLTGGAADPSAAVRTLRDLVEEGFLVR